MELRRVTDAVLRSHMPSFTFLTPAIPLRCQSISWMTVASSHKRQSQKSFTSSARSAVRASSVTTSAPEALKTPNGEKSEKSPSSLSWLSSSTGASRTKPHSSAMAPTGNARSPSNPTALELALNKGNSADDLITAWNHIRPHSNTTTSSAFDRMAQPYMPQVSESINEIIMNGLSNSVIAPPPPRPVMRLTPVTGRTVHVTQDVDVARSFKLLQMSCARNKIKKTFNYQRFHERPGLKRKRLKSERWRRRFMLGFKATVQRVKQMKKQGW